MRIKQIFPPVAGIGRRTGYQQQPPFMCYDSINYWPIDTKTGRKISAVRPAFTRFANAIEVCTMVGQVNGKRSNFPYNSFATALNGQIFSWNGTDLIAATGAQAASVDTNRSVSAASVINNLYITKSGAKPIVFNYANGQAATLVETAGTCPSDCRIAVQWQGALWLAGRLDTDVNFLYGSRVGDPTDWDFTVGLDDEFGAFLSAADYDGVVGAPITALVPQHRDAMIVSTYQGSLILRGHPRQGGLFEPISTQYILGQEAWTSTPDNSVFFMTPEGLMMLPPEFGTVPANVSRNKIPNELVGLDYVYGEPKIVVQYDARWDCIHIFNRDVPGESWMFDRETGGFHRQESGLLVYTSLEFQPTSNADTSGILMGCFDGLNRIERFGEETRRSQIVTGPIMFGERATERGMLENLRVIFGRDTPSSDTTGLLQISTGVDGQDAVNRFEQGMVDYSVDLLQLKANGGVCHPRVSGSAGVIVLTADQGDVAFELMELTLKPMGTDKFQRAAQLPVLGNPQPVSDVSDGFDPDEWTGYQGVTPPAPDEDLPQVTVFLDLSILDNEWWDLVGSVGQDIRATDNNNVRLPLDLIYFDRANKTGTVAVRVDQLAAAPTPIRLWVGRGGAVQPEPDSPFGQYNAYDASWRAFFPTGAGDDRTRYQNDTDASDNITEGDATGPIGGVVTDYSGSNQAWSRVTDFDTANPDIAGLNQFTMVFVAKYDSPANNSPAAIAITESATQLYGVTPLVTSSTTPDVNAAAETLTGAGSEVATTTAGAPSTDWNHFAGVFRTSSRTAYLNGTDPTTDNDYLASSFPLSNLYLGAETDLFLASSFVTMGYGQLHTVARSQAWIKYQADMFNQAVFWEPDDEFTEENDPPEEVPAESVGCPLGPVSQTEAGSWDGYAVATVPSAFDTLDDYTVFIDLSDLPNDWWSNVEADGSDIRATDQDDVFLPLDLIHFTPGPNTGLAAVKLRQLNGPVQEVRLWVGNSSAITVDPCSLYGQYAAYDNDWAAFWPDGSGNDRTINNNHMTTSGSPITELDGPISGSLATRYNANGVGSMGTAELNAGIPEPFSMILAGNITSQTPPRFTNMILASSVPTGRERPYYSLIRVYGKPGTVVTGVTVGQSDAGNFTYADPGSEQLHGAWFTAIFVNVPGAQSDRPLWLNDIGEYTRNEPRFYTSVPVTRVTLGESGPSGTTSYLASMVGIRKSAVGAAWAEQYFNMLDQSTFWGTWTWNAETNSLTQPA